MKALLVCSGGMSSAICAKALQEAAQAAGQELQVVECGTQAFEEEIKRDYAIALVAPQIRHRFDTLKAQAQAANVPCILIQPQGYTPLGGKKLLAQVNQELGL
ncbi:PTS sugar transporter subunit IIB [Vaginisenegalia massiliensis]|uniref:PTS sugar transporter subunit IIB n=1 Tax=Vaginisenegalia massiliensis TaxID=2058294 RepID=UPI000F540C5A|nr:PTS sugar transporter subunit IIB [Vaginisenegalia massiliensis]